MTTARLLEFHDIHHGWPEVHVHRRASKVHGATTGPSKVDDDHHQAIKKLMTTTMGSSEVQDNHSEVTDNSQ
jgi:hypothetical protein